MSIAYNLPYAMYYIVFAKAKLFSFGRHMYVYVPLEQTCPRSNDHVVALLSGINGWAVGITFAPPTSVTPKRIRFTG